MTETMALFKTVQRFAQLAESHSRETELMIESGPAGASDARDLVGIVAHAASIAVNAANLIVDQANHLHPVTMDAIHLATRANDEAARLVRLLAESWVDQEPRLKSLEQVASRVEGRSLLLGLARQEMRSKVREEALQRAASDYVADAV